jgi:hypothetical protein
VRGDGSTDRVLETAEKRPISNLCCTGLYHFARADCYLEAFRAYAMRPTSEWDAAELYVAPLYNVLIAQGCDIRYHLVRSEALRVCGTPAEYEAFRRTSECIGER